MSSVGRGEVWVGCNVGTVIGTNKKPPFPPYSCVGTVHFASTLGHADPSWLVHQHYTVNNQEAKIVSVTRRIAMRNLHISWAIKNSQWIQ